MSKVLLLNLPIQSFFQKGVLDSKKYNPPLGLIYLGTWLELNGHEPVIIDLCYEHLGKMQFLKKVQEIDPILIGISVYTENLNLAVAVAKLIKSALPNVKIALGGPHPSLMPDDGIGSDSIDFLIMNEGESIILELVEALRTNQNLIAFKDIDGLVYKEHSNIIKNKRRKPISDLDILPIPKRELAGLGNYEEQISISTSRGCPGNCIYCSATALSGSKYRTRDIENVFMEIVLLKSMFNEKLHIRIVDDTFTAVPGRVLKFAELIRKYKIGFAWQCESRIDVMNEEMLQQMSSSGCKAIQYGVESGSQTVLDKIRKHISLEYAQKVFDLTYKNNMLLLLSFMLGHFCDTRETMEETASFITMLYEKYVPEIAVSFNTPFPGTWQYSNREKIGLKLTTNVYKRYSLVEPIVETDQFTLNDQREVYYKLRPFIAHYSSLSAGIKKVEEG